MILTRDKQTRQRLQSSCLSRTIAAGQEEEEQSCEEEALVQGKDNTTLEIEDVNEEVEITETRNTIPSCREEIISNWIGRTIGFDRNNQQNYEVGIF